MTSDRDVVREWEGWRAPDGPLLPDDVDLGHGLVPTSRLARGIAAQLRAILDHEDTDAIVRTKVRAVLSGDADIAALFTGEAALPLPSVEELAAEVDAVRELMEQRGDQE